MKKEIKISLPFYKIAYSLFFIVILSLIRGVSFTYEIGIALEAPMALLAATFCADTYMQEIISKRSEIWRLYPMERKVSVLVKRIVIQEIFLLFLAGVGYGLFFLFQNPKCFFLLPDGARNERKQFVIYFAVMAVTLSFWGILSITISSFFRNLWFGIGGALLLWIVMNSTIGDDYFGAWNLFSYTFRTIEQSSDFSWIAGKGVCMVLSIIMLIILPTILQKRG